MKTRTSDSERFSFRAKLWLYETTAAPWHFVTLPVKTGKQIKFVSADVKRGWGSIPVKVTIGKSTWKTSIFPYQGSYVLPLKAEIRKKEKLSAGDTASITVEPL